MTKQPKQKNCIRVKPPISDAVPPFKKARKEYSLNKLQQKRVMESLGRAIYECRQKTKSKDPVTLTALPKGYTVEYSYNYKFSGHPSKFLFYSTNAFLEHLLWLEAMSHPESIEPRRKCKCILCTKARSKKEADMQTDTSYELTSDSPSSSSDITSSAEAFSPSETGSPMPALPAPAASPKSPASRESTPGDPEEMILVYPMKKVLIEQLVNPYYYYPAKFTIPLPKIQQSDESIFLKSLRS
ncbi:uncharacterized protein ATC70_007598 [Mucor velutinosus]|uniref:Cryptic loci regulator 2 N-terminal domain-containing protein n=1 Tax=Mucor velutinosus TaxID=708070 RepID=A0AAN7D3C7_9FUNG|nr:hypothetical protein ATC70_007598 [Mucor velutinosus]